MAYFEIDLMGNDSDIVIETVEDFKEPTPKDNMRKRALEDILRRSPQPQLEIVPFNSLARI